MAKTEQYPNRIAIPGTQWFKNKPAPPEDWGPSLTSQEFKDECNTEKILEKYGDLGLPLPSAPVENLYRDCTDMRNLQEHLNEAKELVQKTEAHFMELPAKIRKKFDNDVGKMASFLASEDPEDIEESRRLGLRKPKAAPEPLDVIVRTDTKTSSVQEKDPNQGPQKGRVGETNHKNPA